jgi:hypothetical protein
MDFVLHGAKNPDLKKLCVYISMELHLPRATKFACPILKYAEIADCLRDINLAITEDDIMKPNKDRLVAIYEFFLETLVDISKERLDELTSIALESAEFPDVIYRSVRLEVLAKHVAQLMAYLGVDDFGLCDIIRAEPGRTRRIFSAIINFLRFREDHVAAFEQLCQQSVYGHCWGEGCRNSTRLKRSSCSPIFYAWKKKLNAFGKDDASISFWIGRNTSKMNPWWRNSRKTTGNCVLNWQR